MLLSPTDFFRIRRCYRIVSICPHAVRPAPGGDGLVDCGHFFRAANSFPWRFTADSDMPTEAGKPRGTHSIRRDQFRMRICLQQNLLAGLTGGGAVLGAPLAESHTVPGAVAFVEAYRIWTGIAVDLAERAGQRRSGRRIGVDGLAKLLGSPVISHTRAR